MQRLFARRVSSSLSHSRCLSQLAHTEASHNAPALPKIPPFDYYPPPYEGPRVDEVLRKRSQYLSPSLFYFYKKPKICEA